MTLKTIVTMINSGLLLFAVACANKDHHYGMHQKTDEVSSVSSTAAATVGASDFVEIGFSKGSSELQESDRASLRNLIYQSRQDGDIDEVFVLSWSDKEYPAKYEKSMSKAERALADERNKSIKTYLKSLKDVDVDTYNMAEKPSTFSKLLNTKDRRLKESLVTAGLATDQDTQGHVNKASHAVVLVKIK